MRGGGLGALGFELLRGAEAAVGLALGEQALGVLGVDVPAARIGGRGRGRPCPGSPGRAGAFVPVEAQPVQVFDELGFEAGFGALEVGVFNAEDELAAGAAGEEPVVERGARIAYVKQAGGGRGKADAGNMLVMTDY